MTVDAGETCRPDQFRTQGTTSGGLYLGGTAFRGEAQVGHVHLISMLSHAH